MLPCISNKAIFHHLCILFRLANVEDKISDTELHLNCSFLIGTQSVLYCVLRQNRSFLPVLAHAVNS